MKLSIKILKTGNTLQSCEWILIISKIFLPPLKYGRNITAIFREFSYYWLENLDKRNEQVVQKYCTGKYHITVCPAMSTTTTTIVL